MWLRDYASQWWSGDMMLIATAWASSQCRVRGVFDRHTDKSTAEREIKKWRKSLVCTERQMLAAIMYVIEGDESKPESQIDADDVLIGGCPYTDRIADAVAAGVGATIEELESKPIRIVEEIITRWARHQMAMAGARADIAIRGRNRDYDAYQAYVSELEKGAVKNGG
jgi:coenzyme F420-reducing hydrogenase gamma subunit